MSEENVEIVRYVCEAWNRDDLEWLLNHMTPDFEFRTVRLFPDLEPVYRGHEDSARGAAAEPAVATTRGCGPL